MGASANKICGKAISRETGNIIGIDIPAPNSDNWNVPLFVFPVTVQLYIVCSSPKCGSLTTLTGSRPLLTTQFSLIGRPPSGLSGFGVRVTVLGLSR
ncbi:hypothetical protein D3C81_1162670 [compost metagenome]